MQVHTYALGVPLDPTAVLGRYASSSQNAKSQLLLVLIWHSSKDEKLDLHFEFFLASHSSCR